HDPPSRRTRPQRGLGGTEESGLAAGLLDASLENHLAAVRFDLLLQFRYHQVDGSVHVGRRVLSTQHDAVPPYRDLNHLCFAQPAAALHAEHHLGILYLVEIPRDLTDLCFGVIAQGWSDIHVLALHDDVNRSELPGSRHGDTSPDASTARAYSPRLKPGNQGTREPRDQGTRVPHCACAVPWLPDPLVPWRRVSWLRGSMVPWS